MLIIMTMMVMTVINADGDSCTVHLCGKSCVTLKKRCIFRACPVAVVVTTSLRTATVVTMSFVLMLCSSFLLR